jgi:hypothetical protein
LKLNKPSWYRGYSWKCHVADSSQITAEVQKLFDVTSPAEEGDIKVQNLCDDNEDDNLERVIEECFACEAEKRSIMLQM